MYNDMNLDYYYQTYAPNPVTNMLIEAMKDERHDRVKYQNMMDMTNDPLVKKQIKFAYDDEGNHYKMFNQIYSHITGRKINIPLPSSVEKYDNLLDAVQSSIDGELEAVELYREILSLMPNQQMRDMVYNIITDEQEHATRFVYLYSMLK